MLEKINRCYPAWLNLLPLIIMFFTILYLGLNYDQLPSRIATHFNLTGFPDGYGSKGSIVILAAIGVATAVGMTLINILTIMRPDDPRKVFNLDPGQLEVLGQARLEEMRIFMARLLFIVTWLVTLMLSYGIWGEVRVGLGLQKGLGIWMMVLAVALIGVSFYMVVKILGWAFTPTQKNRSR